MAAGFEDEPGLRMLAVAALGDTEVDHQLPTEPGHGAGEQHDAVLVNACCPALGMPGKPVNMSVPLA